MLVVCLVFQSIQTFHNCNGLSIMSFNEHVGRRGRIIMCRQINKNNEIRTLLTSLHVLHTQGNPLRMFIEDINSFVLL